MPDKDKDLTPAQERKAAEEKVAAAQKQLEDAQAKLAESRGELLSAQVSRDVPQMVVRVKPTALVVHEGKAYHGEQYGIRAEDDTASPDRMLHGEDHGVEVVMDGPTAMALMMQGQVDILRSEGVE